MSKIDSLSSILENIKPDIVTLNEVKLKNPGNIREFFKKRGYEVLTRTSGGIALAASNKFKLINVTSSNNPNLLVGLLPDLNIRIIAGYGHKKRC